MITLSLTKRGNRVFTDAMRPVFRVVVGLIAKHEHLLPYGVE